MFKNYKIYTVLFILFTLVFTYFVWDYFQYNNERNETVITKGEGKRDEVKVILNAVLDSIQSVTHELADKFSKKQYSKAEIEKIIKQSSLDNDFCIGIAAAFEPTYTKDSIRELYAPYYSKKVNKFQYLEESYDYTNDSLTTAQWYTKPVKKGKGVWSNPYVGQVEQELIFDYGVPFYKNDLEGTKKIYGMVTFTITASYLTKYLHQISLGKAGFAFITNKDNYVISHPQTSLLLKPEIARKTISRLPSFNRLVEENEGYFSSFSQVAQENVEYFFTSLNNNWVLTVVIPKHDLLKSSNLIKKKLMLISVFLTITLILLLIIILKVWQGNTKNLWLFSLSVGLLFLFNIIFIWHLNLSEDLHNDNNSQTKILSTTTIDNYLYERNKKLKQIDYSLKSVEIPTGMFIYDIDLKNAYDVAIIGKIWQKIPDDFKLRNETTFVFPQAAATGISVRVRPMGKEHIDDYWLYSYDFNATIQFDFNYLKYPLNYKKLDFQITYPHPEDNVVFTPDIQSYDFINPSFKPGISYDIYMPNSKILETYYSFHNHNFYTNLGDTNSKRLKDTSVLTFNILVKNVIISSVISNIIPIAIIAVMIFLLPFTVDKREGEIKEGGALNIIQAAGGFFFVLLLSHIQLRNNIETPGFIYLETFYFVMYFMLAVMSTSVMIYLKTNDYPILEYKHNLIFKISYWPILLLSIYILSFFIFY